MGGRKEPVNRVLELEHLPAILGVEDSIIPCHEHAPCPPQPGQNLLFFFSHKLGISSTSWDSLTQDFFSKNPIAMNISLF